MVVEVVCILAAWVVVLACFSGACRRARIRGEVKGAGNGYLLALKDLCDGHLRVEGRTLFMDETVGLFFSSKTGEQIREIDMDELKFEED